MDSVEDRRRKRHSDSPVCSFFIFYFKYDEQTGDAGEEPRLLPEEHPRTRCGGGRCGRNTVRLPGDDAHVSMVTDTEWHRQINKLMKEFIKCILCCAVFLKSSSHTHTRKCISPAILDAKFEANL